MCAVVPTIALLIGLFVQSAHLEAQGTIVILVRRAEYAPMFVLTIAEAGASARLLRTTVGAPDPASATACPH